MIINLGDKVEKIYRESEFIADDVAVNINGNEGICLAKYPKDLLISIDPTAQKLRSHYEPHIHAIPSFSVKGRS